jgi:hypothetical protein
VGSAGHGFTPTTEVPAVVTIYLLFQLVAGQLLEVDAFTTAEGCAEMKQFVDTRVAAARAQRADLPALATECRPFKISLVGA